jgi:hypothetical protein
MEILHGPRNASLVKWVSKRIRGHQEKQKHAGIVGMGPSCRGWRARDTFGFACSLGLEDEAALLKMGELNDLRFDGLIERFDWALELPPPELQML